MGSFLSTGQRGPRSHDATGPAPSPLGTLSKLPPEIRCEIWRYFMPDLRPTSAIRRYMIVDMILGRAPRRLEIMQTSRQMYKEISAMLYNRELCFCVKPAKQMSPFNIHLMIKGLPGARMKDLDYADFSRFKRIRFEIDAPETKGDLQILRYHIQYILLKMRTNAWCFNGFEHYRTSFAHASAGSLPEISIVFLSRGSPIRWEGGIPNGKLCLAYLLRTFEVQYLLDAFEVLKQIKCLKVQLPADMEYDEEMDASIKRLKATTERASQLWKAL